MQIEREAIVVHLHFLRINLNEKCYRLPVFTYSNKTSPSGSLSSSGEGGGYLEGLRPSNSGPA